MHASRNPLKSTLALAILAMALPAFSLQAPKREHSRSSLKAKAFALPEAHVLQGARPEREFSGAAATARFRAAAVATEALRRETGGDWILFFDEIADAPGLMEGKGLPMVPGTANSLTRAKLGLGDAPDGPLPKSWLEARARDFIKSHPDLFQVDEAELVLLPGASGEMLNYLHFVEFEWRIGGIPVEHSRVSLRMNHGNLVQIGQERIAPSNRPVDVTPRLTAAQAWEVLDRHVGGRTANDTVREPGRLLIIPVTRGNRLHYRLVWVIEFKRAGETESWQGRVDAHTGELVLFRDTNEYGQTRGGTYATELPVPEVTRQFPFTDCGGGVFSDAAGNFAGNNCTSTMNGQYVRVVDTCGAISLTTASGDLNFGTSGGYDCTTPGVGGAGNTHAARTQFYNLNKIKEKGRTYLPANAWLSGQIRANVNVAGTCNAYWNGTTVNFFPSGGGCGNTGEVMGVSMHEWGHGMDSNDGNGGSPNNGTGETYGDTTAFLQTHDSCIGNGFLGSNCQGYGDDCTSCTGVRDVDWGAHGAGAPHTAGDMLAGSAPTSFECPIDAGYAGPCGYEGHCESLVSSESVYDLATRDLVTWGLDANTAWQTLDRYWYASRPTATSAYQCPGGTATPSNSNGCNNGSLFGVFRVVDDTDGSLANGTPHASAIFNAFNRHGIGCTSVVNTDQAGACPTLGSTAVVATPTTNSVNLTWQDVPNATRYFVYRNELGCDAGYTKIATVNDPTLTYTDNSVVNGIRYYYRIQAASASDSCTGPISNCESPAPLACTPPAAPTGVSAAAAGVGQITVSWTAGVGVTQYEIYRSRPLGSAWQLAGTVSGAQTSFTDSGLYSGTQYYYMVRAFTGCQSLASATVNATTTGVCNIPPTFAGLASASNATVAACTNNLTWAAGSSNCGGSVTYSVYRSEVPGFNPSTATPIATGLATTTFSDTAALFNTNYYYAVRAVDSVGGTQDGNTVVRASAATGAGTVVFNADFESATGNNAWTNNNFLTPANTTGDWVRGTPTQQTGNFGMTSQPGSCPQGTSCWFTGVNTSPGVDDVDGGIAATLSPVFSSSGFATVGLNMYRWYFNGEPDDGLDHWFLEVSNNCNLAEASRTWTVLETFPDSGPNDKDGTAQTAWALIDTRLEPLLTMTANMCFRARANDNPPTAPLNDPGDLIEGGLDKVTVTGYASCTTCTPPATPTGLAATPNGANRIDLSWNSVAGAVGYQIYRVEGSCGSGYTPLAFVAGTSYSDTAVTGSKTYAYVVRAVNGSDCPSAQSTCASATATGTCAIPATFAGATAATSAGTGTCGVGVTWTAATATCPAASVVYNVYRSTDPDFTPSAANRIAACDAGTPYADATVVYNTRYYYIVRSEQLSAAGPGPCGGFEDTNTVVRNGSPAGATSAQNIFFDNFDSGTGLNGWSTGFFAGSATNWRGITTPCTPAQSGSGVFHYGGNGCTATYLANQTGFAAPPGNSPYGLKIPESATNAVLDFYHRRNFGADADDGAILFVQVNPIGTYYNVDSTWFTAGATTGVTPATAPLGANYDYWTGSANTTMLRSTVNLETACTTIAGGSCAGKEVNIAFTGMADGATNSTGWFLDNVSVTATVGANCTTAAACSMTVAVLPAGTTSVAVNNDILFSVNHSESTGGPYTYQWLRDGAVIPGANGSSYAAREASAGSHTYNVRVSDGVNCTNITDATAATGTWTGGAPVPKPVPDGQFVAGTPMTGAKSGGNILVTYAAASCGGGSANYNVLWGSFPITSATQAFTGGSCGVGTSGSWTGNIPNNSFWVVVGTDGSSYSSFGRNSAGAEETFTGAASICTGQTAQNTSGTCN